LWGVYAREEHPPAQAKAIEWFLLTTEEVQTAEEAARIVALYCRRWRIEEWHRALKSGCKVQEHQHQTAARVKRAIDVDSYRAWRKGIAWPRPGGTAREKTVGALQK